MTSSTPPQKKSRPPSVTLVPLAAQSRPTLTAGSTGGLARGYSRAGLARPRSQIFGQNIDKQDDSSALVVVEGSVLSLNRQKIEDIPSLSGKRFDGQAVVTFIKACDFSVNHIRNIENLQEFKKLTHLALDFNNLRSNAFVNLKLPRLESLSVNNNHIDDLELFIDSLSQAAPALKTLSMLGNPCVPNSFNEPKMHMNYRYFVVCKNPRLRVLDGLPVSQVELKRIQGKQIEAPMHQAPPKFMSPIDKEDWSFNVSQEGELTLMKHALLPVAQQTWAPQYFILGERRLMCYKDKLSAQDIANPVTVIPLAGFQIAEMAQDIAPGFSAFTLFKQRQGYTKTYYFVAQSDVSLQEWIQAFTIQLVDKLEIPPTPRVNLGEKGDETIDDLEIRKWKSNEEYQAAVHEREMKQAHQRIEKLQGFNIAKEDVVLGRVLGKGSFGSVFEGKCRGKACAVKKLHVQNLTQEALTDFAGEVEILSKIHHPHIISCFGACTEPGHLMIVTELMQADLMSIMKDSARFSQFPLTRLLKMCKDAALGINWLHGMDPMIIHRDIKPSNFLMDEHFRVVVADFGLSEGVKKGSSTWDESGAFKGTVSFTAPEILRHSEFDERSDVYSFGAVLYCLYAREVDPFPELKHLNNEEFINKIVWENYRPTISDECPLDLKRLIEECWAPESKSRPSFEEIIRRLEDIIVNLNIRDELGATFWKENFGDREKVRFTEFAKKFSDFIGEDISSSIEVIRAIFCGIASFDNVKNDPYVSLRRVGQVLQWFGPLERSDAVIARINKLVREPWFHGDISAETGSVRLLHQSPGTFLVRFSSSNPGAYSLVYHDSRGELGQRLIYRRATELSPGAYKPVFSILTDEGEKKDYNDIQSLIDDDSRLQKPCPGSQYEVILSLIEANKDESPLGDEMRSTPKVSPKLLHSDGKSVARKRHGTFSYAPGESAPASTLKAPTVPVPSSTYTDSISPRESAPSLLSQILTGAELDDA